MKKRRYIEKLFTEIAACLLSIVTAVALFVPVVFRVSASSSDEREFDNTSVLEDLSDEDLAQYPANAKGEISLLRFMEYGYQDDTSEWFGLYVYVYNPAQVEFSTREGANTINMAIAYKQAKPAEYANLTLKLCGYSTGVYSRLLYKFRVVGKAVENIYENAKLFATTQGKRRYDVAGVQFWEKGAASADKSANIASADLGAVKDYAVERTFFYTGYAKGCGSGAEEQSTLACSYSELTTVKLDLQHTNYRMENPKNAFTSSVLGEFDGSMYDEVNSVYFSVPDSLIEQYGKITKIKAEWYEYKTVPIFVTKDENAYNELLDWINVDVGEYDAGNPWRVFWNEIRHDDTRIYEYHSLYNQKKETKNYDNLRQYSFVGTFDNVPSIEWLFYRENPTTLRDYDVTRAEVEEWAKNYSATHKEQDKLDGRKTFWAEGLFADRIDTERLELLADQSATRGYVVQEIAADEKKDILQQADQSWWEKFIGKTPEIETTTYSPIKMLKSTDLSGTDKTVCDRLLINVNDYRNADGMNNDVGFYEFCQNAFDNDETPVLFHFANTEYYASAARFDKRGNNAISDYDGYVCQQTCFLDFDVIQLTFERDGTETVLACVADPIDIFNGTTAPNDNKLVVSKVNGCASFDVKKLFSVVILVLAGILIWKIVKIFVKWSDRKAIRDTRREVKKNRKNKR